MLRIPAPITGAAGAKKYYNDGLRRDDYYRGQGIDQEIAGEWGGKGAARLGLEGEIDPKAFDKLCDNINPATDEKLTARTRSGRRVGYDINFHCPKSVSALVAVTGDQRIVEAFRASVRDTMDEVEGAMGARVRSRGRNEDRHTGNIVYAEYVHFTARPVGGIPDPHLHSHCFTFNATHDKDRWKAGQFGEIKKNAPYFESAFHARFSKRLADMGFPIETTAKGWEIGGVPQTVNAKFSRRTAQIEEEARKRGIINPKRKDQLGAWTRSAKDPDLTPERLKEVWLGRLTDAELSALRGISEGRFVDPKRERKTADVCVAHARGHSFERASAVPAKSFARSALAHGRGEVTPAEVQAAMKKDDSLLFADVGGVRMVTTRRHVVDERKLVNHARSERNRYKPLAPGRHRFKDAKLRGETAADQRAAVSHILSSRDGVIAVRGGAGTGKTSLMREAADAIEAAGRKAGRHHGCKVHVFAPGAEAARGVLRGEGFATADTVARLLASEHVQRHTRGGVIWIDEAGQVGTEDLNRIFEIASANKARVILSYDTRQHTPVSPGDAVRLLEEQGGVAPAQVSTIHRQRGADLYRAAVAEFAAGRTDEGLDQLEAMAAVFEIENDGTRNRAIAKRYADTTEERKIQGKKELPKTALVVAPTHRERRAVTENIRGELKKRSQLRGADRPLLQLDGLKLTAAEKADARNFDSGQWLTFHQNVAAGAVGKGFDRWVGRGSYGAPPERGITRGERFEVVGPTDSGGVLMRGEGGRLLAVPLDRPATFEVNAARRLPVAAGELLRMTKGGRTLDGHELRNGGTHRVKSFTREGNLRLSNGWEIDAAYGHLEHGYTMTSHAAQGSTVDRVLIAQDSQSGRAASAEQFYVSMSRGRESVEVFTDDRVRLRDSIRRSSERVSASELIEPRKARATDLRPETNPDRKGRFIKITQQVQRFADQAARVGLATSQAVDRLRSRGERSRPKPQAEKQRIDPSRLDPGLEPEEFEPDA